MPEMEKALILLTVNIPSYEKLPRKRILELESSPIFGKLEQTLTCMLNGQDTEVYRNEEFQLAQRDFMTYMNEATYLQKIEVVGSVLSFLTIIFVIFLCLFH